jgi:hypothetical protein
MNAPKIAGLLTSFMNTNCFINLLSDKIPSLKFHPIAVRLLKIKDEKMTEDV